MLVSGGLDLDPDVKKFFSRLKFNPPLVFCMEYKYMIAMTKTEGYQRGSTRSVLTVPPAEMFNLGQNPTFLESVQVLLDVDKSMCFLLYRRPLGSIEH
jgi:hypothetical protein